MSASRLLLVQVLNDGARSEIWRTAIAEAGARAGWEVRQHWGGEVEVPTPDHDLVVVTWDPSELTLEATDVVILTCDPERAIPALEALGVSHKDAVHHVSRRFAQASGLIANGVAWYPNSTEKLDLPGLGEVSVSRDTEREHGKASQGGPLAIYDALPPASGAEADWDVGLVSYPAYRETDTGTSRISLLGRRRVLFSGPHVWLTPGRWRVDAVVELDCESLVVVYFEWGLHHEQARHHVEMREAGRYAISMIYDWPEAASAEFRCHLVTPKLEGELIFESLHVTRE